jgi:hypothetical protein
MSGAAENQAQIDVIQRDTFLLMKPKAGKYDTRVRVIHDSNVRLFIAFVISVLFL